MVIRTENRREELSSDLTIIYYIHFRGNVFRKGIKPVFFSLPAVLNSKVDWVLLAWAVARLQVNI